MKRFALALAIVAAIPVCAQAQVVSGRTLGPAGEPIAGAIVVLVGEGDSTIARTLSASDGMYQLHAVTPGTYRLRTLRIGYRPETTEPFALAATDHLTRDINLSNIAVRLEAVRVTGRSECRAGTADRAALDAWNEAKKALLASVLTRQTRAMQSTIALFTQQLDAKGERVLHQAVETREGTSVRPMGALRTPDDFADHGYAQADGKDVRYDGPDENVLLSDRFAEGHCLHLVPDDSGAIAVAFAPVRPRDGVVEIEGTLRLDARTAELHTLEFRYTNVDRLLQRGGIGGRIDFARLIDGGWVIDRWALRLPVIGHVPGALFRPGTDEIAWIDVTGGLLTEARTADRVLWRAHLAAVEGLVHADSGGPPVTGAAISLAGTDYRATTDRLGTFVIPDVFAGRYRMGVQWPPLDSMGVVSSTVTELVVPDTGVVTAQLAVPTLERGLAIACGRKVAARHDGLVRGYVEPSATRSARGMRVRVSWHVQEQRDSQMVVREGEKSGKVDDLGRFSVCGVPRATPLHVFIGKNATSELTSVEIPADRPFVWLNLQLP